MTRGKISCVAVLFLACMLAIVPAAAADNSTAHDAATGYYNAGTLLLTSGDYNGAIQMYDMALASNTSVIKVTDALLYTYQNKAYAQLQLGNYTDAIATADAGLVLYPQDQKLWNNKGFAQYSLGKYGDAITSYNKALEIDGSYTNALINKGDAYMKLGNYQDAVATYKAALVSDPESSVVPPKLATAENAAASALPAIPIALAVIVIIVAAGVAYYVTRKGAAGDKTDDKAPDKKDTPKKNQK